jgi:hypothetical protein
VCRQISQDKKKGSGRSWARRMSICRNTKVLHVFMLELKEKLKEEYTLGSPARKRKFEKKVDKK